MVQDVGFWEAVGLWWSGQKLEDFTMYGLPMLWWARIGKYLQFLGGALVVLDLIGSERIQGWSEGIKKAGQAGINHTVELVTRRRTIGIIKILAWLAGGIVGSFIFNPALSVLVLVISLVIFPALALLFLIPFGFTTCFAWLVGLGKHGHAAKWVAFAFVFIGFHLDLLGS